MPKIHVETLVSMPDDFRDFIKECFRIGGNERLQPADLYEWMPSFGGQKWWDYLTELELKYEHRIIWFHRRDYQ